MNRKRQRQRKRRQRLMIAYILRISIMLVVFGMIVLMFCGCLYIRDFFARKMFLAEEDSNTEMHSEDSGATSVEKALFGVCVVLDAGHGGRDGGTVGGDMVEKEINLSVVLLLKDSLERYGAKVMLTRNTDEELGLSERAEFANQSDADLFVSLHCNYYEGDATIAGLECYYYPENTEGRGYAESIIASVGESEEIKVREAKAERYHVLSETTMPAVLIEMGFLSNHEERRKLADSDYQELLAEKITEGILKNVNSF